MPTQLAAINYSIENILLNIACAFILSFLAALVYRATHRGLSYSQSFTISLTMIGFLIAAMVMVIGGSLSLAFAGLGAMSLIRFRTAIKDVRDVVFVLLVVVIGFASGTGNYMLAAITAGAAMLVSFALYKTNFGSIRKYDYVLSFSAESARFSGEQLREIFKEFLKYDNLLNMVARDNGRVLDHSFNIKFINPSEIEKFAKRLAELSGVSEIDIISAKNDIEY
ncbi:MAG: hypothetical protein A3C85_03920 [Candidatus Doudnabacteria bacterium RIFCSPHIGHO2_02_FULL_48_21]|uniref:DUF4956 domain-containing protein n=1 Tax=Candidatus Doudnabacteria bacterium RIFCSPLOWO2_02_FULL_48_13 TaxID=1817845 RepID=A0A1F5QBT2_9BACT|nr:MAG: hypothetical protein A3K05_01725 [Candidatus Doudnabacteria bacterium RIFCSPHIGHO2_01_48_18]OGE78776.1 MAG: hypothetical protein A2668_04570 [Candidatus Doudnabacteria bacterium RIFCSPHIGHO2_01_FULL_48_180]OGE91790.1 MAG: hypothetical protein A3F44_00260 [Candidatus Doudnabacteria bacterium RIFCSPHIGHO2_12_FULL_47_25]OGE93603.1 MAG: hypothetical protein A3C85_03920 [Candidatus Doudnabacteria bacterium RIFCSPHIGHO2_02_FULL_48_21]OGE97885.1 MAG: hypothetical protein A3A83_04630 [Candidatu